MNRTAVRDVCAEKVPMPGARRSYRATPPLASSSVERMILLGLAVILLCTWGLYCQVQFLKATKSPKLHTSNLEQITPSRVVREVVWEAIENGSEDDDDDSSFTVDETPTRASHLRSEGSAVALADPILSYVCRGWRQTGGCDPNGKREAQNDKKCYEAIPGGSSGYCEFYDPATNATLHLLPSTCKTFRRDARFSCNMAIDILMFHKHAESYRHPYLLAGPEDAMTFINHSTYTGKMVAPASPSKDESGDGRVWYDRHPRVRKVYPRDGIVMVVYEKALVSMYTLIRLLRTYHNSTLPIELWYRRDELAPNHTVLAALTTDFRDVRLREIKDPRAVKFYVKPYTIFFSHFQNVLFLDADNFPVRDPAYLFTSAPFLETGAIFWPDFWHSGQTIFNIHDESAVWTLLHTPFVDMFEQESGQLVIDRARHEAGLHRLMFYAFHRVAPQMQPAAAALSTPPTTAVEDNQFEDVFKVEDSPLPQDPNLIQGLKLAWGDKDLFRFAWMTTNSSYYMIPKPPGSLGLWGWIKYLRPNATPFQRYCGQSMLQYDTDGQMLFLHRNTLKLGQDKATRVANWQYIQEFRPEAATVNYTIKCWAENTYSCFGVTEGTNSVFTGQLVTAEVQDLEKVLLKFADAAADMLSPTLPPTTYNVDPNNPDDKLIPNMHHNGNQLGTDAARSTNPASPSTASKPTAAPSWAA